jgi:DNA adenine methylase
MAPKEGELLGNSPLNYTGNKACICPYLLDIMPPHEGYIEAFCGSAEVFLSKEPAEREILNDYNGDLMHFWRVLQSDNLAFLIGSIFLSINGEEFFRENRELLRCRPNVLDDLRDAALQIETFSREEINAAAAFFATQFYSFSSTGTSYAIRGKNIVPKLRLLVAAHLRMQQVSLLHRDYKDAIAQFAAPNYLIFLDPPYVDTENCYQKSNFGRENHAELFRFLYEEVHQKHGGQCKFIITYNDCALVREQVMQFGFNLYTQNRLHNMTQQFAPGGQFTELIITNYDALEVMNHKAFLRSQKMDQLSLFE